MTTDATPNDRDPILDDPACKAAAKAVIVAIDRLHRAIADGSPPGAADMLTTYRLAGAMPVCTVLETHVGAYKVHAGLRDHATKQTLSTFEMDLCRTDLGALLADVMLKLQ